MKISGRNKSIAILLGIIAVFACAGCGPTQEEIRAREQAKLELQRQQEAIRRKAAEERRRAEEARRQAEEARQAQVRAVEAAGDEAVRSGDFNTALQRYREVLNLSAGHPDEDQRVREKIIKFVLSLKRQPPVPEEARRYAVRAQTLVKTKQGAGYAQASAELSNALRAAPWWADGYYNLGLMQQGAEDFGGAIRSLKLYLLAETNPANAAAVRNKIYELEVLKEEAGRIQAMAGQWKNPKSGRLYTVSIAGRDFKAVGSQGYVLRGKMDGNAIEGTITVPAERGWGNANDCMTPEYTAPLSARISADGKTITFNYMSNNYRANFWNRGTGHYQGECISVTVTGASPDEFSIAR